MRYWRRRVGIEPTGDGLYRPPLDLKSRAPTRTHSPPLLANILPQEKRKVKTWSATTTPQYIPSM